MAPYLHQYSAVTQIMQFLVLFETYLKYNWCKFSIIIKNIGAGTASNKGAIWDEFSEQSQHQSIRKPPYLMPD